MASASNKKNLKFRLQPSNMDEEQLKILNDFMGKMGISAQITDSNDYKYLSFEIDTEEYIRKTSRHAGAKYVGNELTVSEVFLYNQNHTSKQTAEYCEMSVRTYFRHVRRLKEKNLWNAESLYVSFKSEW